MALSLSPLWRRSLGGKKASYRWEIGREPGLYVRLDPLVVVLLRYGAMRGRVGL